MIELLFELFWSFFQIGLFTFGGGYAMIPMIEEAVMNHGWLQSSSLSLIDFIAISESTPGPFAINIATFVGMTEAGIFGAFFATLGVVLPSFLVILLVARFFTRFSSNPIVQGIMKGIRPVVVGILLSVMLTFAIKAVFHVDLLAFSVNGFDYLALIIFVIIFLFSRFIKKVSPILIILISATLGIILYGLF
jgi:chromate transporter